MIILWYSTCHRKIKSWYAQDIARNIRRPGEARPAE